MIQRVFLIVLDSLGIGNAPDAATFGDAGSNTLASIAANPAFCAPTLGRLGLFHIDGVCNEPPAAAPLGCFARLEEASLGKDTTIGHWEIAGVESPQPLPVYPNGFPPEVIAAFEAQTGRKTLCNQPYSGTQVLEDYGAEHLRTGALIVYTSADSVFQIAANEALVPVAQLYEYCALARALLTGTHSVGRVIARPFVGSTPAEFRRTANRHDYSLKPPAKTMLDCLQAAGLATIGIGKIYDIFDGVGISRTIKTVSNANGMEETLALAKENFKGLAFINLVDFDMLYGHRNDCAGYAKAVTEFDMQLAQLLPLLKEDDLLLLTADHGCDPATPSTDHSRECVPLLAYGKQIAAGKNLGTLKSFTHIAGTICDALGIAPPANAKSLWGALQKS